MPRTLRERLRDAVSRDNALAYGRLVEQLFAKGVTYQDIIDMTQRAVSPDSFTAADYEVLVMEYEHLTALIRHEVEMLRPDPLGRALAEHSRQHEVAMLRKKPETKK